MSLDFPLNRWVVLRCSIFFTQIVADLAFSRPVDRYGGVRPFITLGGHFLAFVGFLFLALAPPRLFPNNTYLGLMVATIIYSIGGGGLFELLLSAIVQAIPGGDAKESAMSLLHSFYAWGGFIVVVIGTTLMIQFFGRGNWMFVVLIWSVFPLLNFINFLTVPPLAPPAVHEDHRTKIRELLASRYFLLVVLGIAVGGATEVSMSQWTSTFAETALGLPKEVGGDLVGGLCLFALLLGTIRAIYGAWGGTRFPLHKAMLMGGAILCVVCYLVAALSPLPIISLIACIFAGLGAGLLWPGSVVNGANRFPLAGSSLFAFLAAGGDAGAAFGPWLIGLTADVVPNLVTKAPWLRGLSEADAALRSGMLVGTMFPILMVLFLIMMHRLEKKT